MSNFSYQTRFFSALFFCLTVLLAKMTAQTKNSPHFDMRRIAAREGMTTQVVTSFCADASGVWWIGTFNGLYSFDGFRLDRFDNNEINDPMLLGINVYSLASDTNNQNIVFASTNKGVLAIDPVRREIIPENSIGLPDKSLTSFITIEKSADGCFFWLFALDSIYKLVKTEDGKYRYHYVGTTPETKAAMLTTDPYNPDGIWILPRDSAVYYLNSTGLQRFDIIGYQYSPVKEMGLAQIIYTNNDIISWDYSRNVYRLNKQKGAFEALGRDVNLSNYIPELTAIDLNSEQKPMLRRYSSVNSDQHLLATDMGFFIVRKKLYYFKTFEALRGEEIRGIYADSSGKWLASTYNGTYAGQYFQNSIQRFNISHIWSYLPLFSTTYLLAQELPESVFLWDMKAYKRLPEVKLIDKTNLQNDKYSGLSLCRDARETIWLGTYNYLLWAPNKFPLQFQPLTEEGSNVPVNFHFVRALHTDNKSGVWVGHENGLMHIIYDEVKKTYVIEKGVSYLKDISVSDLYQDNQQRMWVATKGRGIACMNLKDPKKPILWYNNENGLCNDVTCRIESSHRGNVLWISTHNGISRFDLLSGQFQNYFKESGFPDNEFNSAASAQLSDGSLLFGGLSGLMGFHPDSIPKSRYYHKTIISRFKYYEKKLKKLVDFPVFFSSEISLPPYPEYFEIYLGTTELLSAEKIRFRYRLHNHSDIWTYNSGREVIKFIRLPPGRYTFEAQSISPDGDISSPVFLSIFVAAPFYETWWFIVVVILLLLCVLYLSYRYRLQQILQEQHMRQQIADDLHDDIGNKLNIISIIAQRIVKSHPKNDPQNEELSKLIDVSRNASRNLNAMIWSVDSKKDKLSSLFDRMQDFADGYLRPLGIKFNFIIKGSQQNKNIIANAKWFCKKVKIDGNFSGFEKLLAGEI
jgi:hypothetical protein